MTPSALETSTAWGLPRREGGTPSTRPLAAKAPDPPSCLHVHFPEEALSKTLERLSRSSGAQELARWLGDLSLPRAPRHSAVASGGQQVTGVPAVSLFSQGLLSDFTTRVNKSSPSQQVPPTHATPLHATPTQQLQKRIFLPHWLSVLNVAPASSHLQDAFSRLNGIRGFSTRTISKLIGFIF